MSKTCVSDRVIASIAMLLIFALGVIVGAFGMDIVAGYNIKSREPVVEYIVLEIPQVTETEEESASVEPSIPEEDITLLSLVTMAEAEGEIEKGKRLVIDTILNRVDSPRFPNSIREVVYQSNQFTSMWNGRVDKCYVRDDIRQLVLEELENRSNGEVLFFRSGHYGCGTPLFQVGNHYFSK